MYIVFCQWEYKKITVLDVDGNNNIHAAIPMFCGIVNIPHNISGYFPYSHNGLNWCYGVLWTLIFDGIKVFNLDDELHGFHWLSSPYVLQVSRLHTSKLKL